MIDINNNNKDENSNSNSQHNAINDLIHIVETYRNQINSNERLTLLCQRFLGELCAELQQHIGSASASASSTDLLSSFDTLTGVNIDHSQSVRGVKLENEIGESAILHQSAMMMVDHSLPLPSPPLSIKREEEENFNEDETEKGSKNYPVPDSSSHSFTNVSRQLIFKDEDNKNDNTTASASTSTSIPNDQQYMFPDTSTVVDSDDFYDSALLSSITLSKEQEKCVDLVVNQGRSLLITGGPGVGRTMTLRRIVSDYTAKCLSEQQSDGSNNNSSASDLLTKIRTLFIALCAPSNPTAFLVQGITLHSFIGYNNFNDTNPNDFSQAWKRENELRQVRLLIIDDISGIDAHLFEYTSRVLITIRNSEKLVNEHHLSIEQVQLFNIPDEIIHKFQPFDGIQLVLAGDFLGLKPVVSDTQKREIPLKNHLAFNCVEFSRLFLNTFGDNGRRAEIVQLTHNFRQSNKQFQTALDEIRLEKISDASIEYLESLDREYYRQYPGGPVLHKFHEILPLRLFDNNKNVDDWNTARYSGLPSESREYTFLLQKQITNLDSYTSDRKNEIRSSVSNSLKHLLAPSKLTLKIGAQVMLLRNLSNTLVTGTLGIVTEFVDVHDIWDQSYSSSSFFTYPSKNIQAMVNQYFETNWKKAHMKTNNSLLVPKVRFVNGEELVVVPNIFILASKWPAVNCIAYQVPLMIAWASTIFKINGMTLDHVYFDCSRIFHYAYTYWALSRAKDPSRLQVVGFQPQRAKADPNAREFWNAFQNGTINAFLEKNLRGHNNNHRYNHTSTASPQITTNVHHGSLHSDSPNTLSNYMAGTPPSTPSSLNRRRPRDAIDLDNDDDYSFMSPPPSTPPSKRSRVSVSPSQATPPLYQPSLTPPRARICRFCSKLDLSTKPFVEHHFTAVPDDWETPFDRAILINYLYSKDLTVSDILSDIINRIENDSDFRQAVSGMVTSRDLCCSQCARDLFYQALVEYRKSIPMDQLHPSANQFLKDTCLTVSGIGQERAQLREQALKHGATYTNDYTNKVTHIIVANDNPYIKSDKVTTALSQGKLVVHRRWFDNCIEQKRRISETSYIPRQLQSNRRHSPATPPSNNDNGSTSGTPQYTPPRTHNSSPAIIASPRRSPANPSPRSH